MKILNMDFNEQVTIKAGGDEIILQPIRKSGRKVCVGITAPDSVFIGNPSKTIEEGLEGYSFIN